MNNVRDTVLKLVRIGVGKDDLLFAVDDWAEVYDVAARQGLIAIALDGYNRLFHKGNAPELPASLKMKWIVSMYNCEAVFNKQAYAASEMAKLFEDSGIRTYVLKGCIVAECYPIPNHRHSADIDCFLLPSSGNSDVWELGNQLIEQAGYDVYRGFYKNSSFHLPGLLVENHRFMVPFRGNKSLKKLEKFLQNGLRADKGLDKIEGTDLYRPPVMVSALFLIEHAYSHFLHEGLTWRHVLDWMMFSRKHREEIDWEAFDRLIEDYGFGKFYKSYMRLGQFLLGEFSDDKLTPADWRMLADVWAPLDLHESLHGVKAKFQLAGNYWRARWKYRYFTDITWIRALSEWVFGAVFDKEPRLGNTSVA